MTLYNVLTPVVALVEADSQEQALRLHAAQIQASGHTVHEEGADAFESEPIEEPDQQVADTGRV